MMDKPFKPNWRSAPGETIKDIMSEHDMDAVELAAYMECDVAIVEGLLTGKQVITEDLAESLSEVVGSSPEFWLNRDLHYREGLTD